MKNWTEPQSPVNLFCPNTRVTGALGLLALTLLLSNCTNDLRGRDVTTPTFTGSLEQSEIEQNESVGLPEPIISNVVRPNGNADSSVRYIRALPNDTVRSIASRVNADPDQIAQMNNVLPDSLLRTGQLIAVPVRTEEANVEEISRIASQALKDEEQTNSTNGTPAIVLRDPFDDNELPPPPASNQPLPTNIENANLPASPEFSQYQTPVSEGQLQMPVQGEIIRQFSPVTGSEGIDIAAPAGSPVVAAAEGEVALLSQTSDDKALLLIRHPDNLFTVYSNLSNVVVEKGSRVSRGQSLGVVASGSKEFVHFEVRVGTKSTDPVPYLF